MVLGGVAKAAGGAAKSGGAASGIMQNAVQGALGDAIGAVDKSIKLLMMLNPIGASLIIINKTLGALIAGIESGFTPLLKVIGAIGKMLGLIIMPFANLLIPLLLPVLQLLKPVVTFLNIFLKPLFAMLMKASKDVVPQIIQQLMGGDILGALGTFMDFVITQLQVIFDYLRPMLEAALQALISAVYSFLTIDFEQVKSVLVNLLGEDLGDVVTNFIKVLHGAVSAVMGFVSQLVGGGVFDSLFGEGEFENIKETNQGFKIGTEVGEVLQGLWDQLNAFLGSLEENPISTLWGIFAGAIELAAQMLTDFQEKGLIGVVEELVETIQMWINTAIQKAIDAITSFLSKQWPDLLDALGDESSGMIGAINKWADKLNRMNIADIIEEVVEDWLGGHKSKESSGGWSSGSVGFDTSSSGGGGFRSGSSSNTYNINVSGVDLSASKIQESMERSFATASREGWFQLG